MKDHVTHLFKICHYLPNLCRVRAEIFQRPTRPSLLESPHLLASVLGYMPEGGEAKRGPLKSESDPFKHLAQEFS